MHIALIISSLQTGGAERVLSELANAWVSREHKISLITLTAPEEIIIYPLDTRVHLIQLNQVVGENIPLHLRLIHIVKRILRIRKALNAVKPDVIISFVDVTNVTTLLASRFLGVPVIVAERTHPAYYQLPPFYNYLRRITYFWADKVISQTSSASAYFSSLPKEKKGVIPNSVKKPGLIKNQADILRPVQHIVSVGRLCPNKGFQILIQAFADLASTNPDLKLTIYGEGMMRGNLEMQIQALKLTERIYLPGTVTDIEMALKQADLFVFPSYFEGFPNALCEAMTMGLPVIASNCSGTIDIIRDGVDGRLFSVGDTHQLTRLLQELMEDSVQRVRLSKGALTVSDRFNETSILKLWDEVLMEVVSR